MTKYKSPIHLGAEYRDERTGIQGHASAVIFHSTGCTDVDIEYMSDALAGKEPKEKVFSEARLVPVGPEPKKAERTYKSDLQLDEIYTTKEGFEGRLAWIEFFEHRATQGIIQVIQKDKQGNLSSKLLTVDEYRLTKKGDDKPAEAKENPRGSTQRFIDAGGRA